MRRFPCHSRLGIVVSVTTDVDAILDETSSGPPTSARLSFYGDVLKRAETLNSTGVPLSSDVLIISCSYGRGTKKIGYIVRVKSSVKEKFRFPRLFNRFLDTSNTR